MTSRAASEPLEPMRTFSRKRRRLARLARAFSRGLELVFVVVLEFQRRLPLPIASKN